MFRDREIRRLALARFISMTGSEATFFVGIWGRAAFELQATPAQLALVMAVMGLSGLATSTVSGALVDRYGPRRVLIAGELAVVPATLALALPDTLGQLAVAVGLANAAAMVVYNAITAFPALLTADPDRLGRANAALEVAGTAAFVAGSAGGAALVALAGLDAVFVADAMSSLTAVALCAGLAPVWARERIAAQAREASPNRWNELTAGARFAYGHPRLLFTLMVGLLVWLSFGVFGALEPLYFRDVLRAGPATLGWVNAVFGGGLAAGAILLERAPRRFASLPRITVLAAASGLGAMAYTGTATLWVVVGAAAAWGTVLGMLLPTVRTLIQLETPEAIVGRVMGVVQVHERAGDLLPLTFAPALATAVGAQVPLVACGALIAALGVALLPLARRLEQGSPMARPAPREPLLAVVGDEAVGAGP